MPFLIFIAISFSIIFLVLFLIIYIRWRNNNKYSSRINSSSWRVFENIKISSETFGLGRSFIGFTTKSRLFLHDKFIIIVASKMSFSLIQSDLPIIFDKENKVLFEKIKMNNWNSITIETHQFRLHSGNAKIEYLLETKDKEQKIELYNELKNWC